jgi:hypothetical protein
VNSLEKKPDLPNQAEGKESRESGMRDGSWQATLLSGKIIGQARCVDRINISSQPSRPTFSM